MKIPIIIDGTMVQVEEGTMIIKAARKAGIVVPTLCHHETVKPYGSCRLCMVEVLQNNQRRLAENSLWQSSEGLSLAANGSGPVNGVF